MTQLNKITYVSNAGVLIEINNKKILIDSLCNSEVALYKSTPSTIKQQIISGTPPFNNIDLLLFTHHHSDHFDLNTTMEFLKYNKDTVVISTTEVISKINNESPDLENNRLITVNPARYSTESIVTKGISIECISMLHEGNDYQNVENIGYLVDIDGKKIFHVGDAKPVLENYRNLNLIQESIDLLIAPFPYVGISAGRQIIKKYILPKKIAVAHLPYRELDCYGWIDTTKKYYKKVQDNFIETVFLEEIGDSIVIS